MGFLGTNRYFLFGVWRGGATQTISYTQSRPNWRSKMLCSMRTSTVRRLHIHNGSTRSNNVRPGVHLKNRGQFFKDTFWREDMVWKRSQEVIYVILFLSPVTNSVLTYLSSRLGSHSHLPHMNNKPLTGGPPLRTPPRKKTLQLTAMIGTNLSTFTSAHVKPSC